MKKLAVISVMSLFLGIGVSYAKSPDKQGHQGPKTEMRVEHHKGGPAPAHHPKHENMKHGPEAHHPAMPPKHHCHRPMPHPGPAPMHHPHGPVEIVIRL